MEGKGEIDENYFARADAKGAGHDDGDGGPNPEMTAGSAEGKDAGDGGGNNRAGESKESDGAAAGSGSGVAAPPTTDDTGNAAALVPFQDVFGPDPIVKRLCDYWGKVLQTDMDGFFQENCEAFEPDPDDPQGHKLEYTEIHARYERIVEGHLRDFVAREGLARKEELYQRLATVAATNPMAALTVRLVLCASDYQCFVEIMRAKLEHEKRERAWAANEARLAREGKAADGDKPSGKGNIWSDADAWDEVD